ncbi:hypothetical protein, partial [Bradyrhizobium sp. Leo170]|uniref:hypothetical protein n=1 Tax=Bradyrhizobium sp. Leo170 TaxID=1571199 RepID=UPI001A9128E2
MNHLWSELGVQAARVDRDRIAIGVIGRVHDEPIVGAGRELPEPRAESRLGEFYELFQGDLCRPVLRTKIFRLTRRANQHYDSARLTA